MTDRVIGERKQSFEQIPSGRFVLVGLEVDMAVALRKDSE